MGETETDSKQAFFQLVGDTVININDDIPEIIVKCIDDITRPTLPFESQLAGKRMLDKAKRIASSLIDSISELEPPQYATLVSQALCELNEVLSQMGQSPNLTQEVRMFILDKISSYDELIERIDQSAAIMSSGFFEWFDEHVVKDLESYTSFTSLYTHYLTHSAYHKSSHLNKRKFAQSLRLMGATPMVKDVTRGERKVATRLYKGVKLNTL